MEKKIFKNKNIYQLFLAIIIIITAISIEFIIAFIAKFLGQIK